MVLHEEVALNGFFTKHLNIKQQIQKQDKQNALFAY